MQAKLNAITFQWMLLACSAFGVQHCYGAFTQQNVVTDDFYMPLTFTSSVLGMASGKWGSSFEWRHFQLTYTKLWICPDLLKQPQSAILGFQQKGNWNWFIQNNDN